jgi:hypothetical protein
MNPLTFADSILDELHNVETHVRRIHGLLDGEDAITRRKISQSLSGIQREAAFLIRQIGERSLSDEERESTGR